MDVSLWDVRRANSIVRRVLDTPSKLFSYWPWKWLASAIDDSFQGCLNVQRTALLSQQKAVDVLIGSSWGGAVAAALLVEGSWSGPTILLCPALRAKDRWFGSESKSLSADAVTARLAGIPATVKARCLLVHGDQDQDSSVPLSDSEALAESTYISLEVIPTEDTLSASSFRMDGSPRWWSGSWRHRATGGVSGRLPCAPMLLEVDSADRELSSY